MPMNHFSRLSTPMKNESDLWQKTWSLYLTKATHSSTNGIKRQALLQLAGDVHEQYRGTVQQKEIYKKESYKPIVTSTTILTTSSIPITSTSRIIKLLQADRHVALDRQYLPTDTNKTRLGIPGTIYTNAVTNTKTIPKIITLTGTTYFSDTTTTVTTASLFTITRTTTTTDTTSTTTTTTTSTVTTTSTSGTVTTSTTASTTTISTSSLSIVTTTPTFTSSSTSTTTHRTPNSYQAPRINTDVSAIRTQMAQHDHQSHPHLSKTKYHVRFIFPQACLLEYVRHAIILNYIKQAHQYRVEGLENEADENYLEASDQCRMLASDLEEQSSIINGREATDVIVNDREDVSESYLQSFTDLNEQ
ncbi:unnamed protein product [Adineta steineri]|uniref:Uncharacterized protein n=1 Tax=Adineta steineri TaxID=433720 RepID=A0A815TC53_9BILA|nr:unnamed protein product [Adineta steineri]CAF3745942.1 unnamed protein product [Adineta steineri]